MLQVGRNLSLESQQSKRLRWAGSSVRGARSSATPPGAGTATLEICINSPSPEEAEQRDPGTLSYQIPLPGHPDFKVMNSSVSVESLELSTNLREVSQCLLSVIIFAYTSQFHGNLQYLLCLSIVS